MQFELPGVGPIQQRVLKLDNEDAQVILFGVRSFWDCFGESIQRGMPFKPEWLATSTIEQASYDAVNRCLILRQGQRVLIIDLNRVEEDATEYSVWTHGQWSTAQIEEALQQIFGSVLTPFLDSKM